MYASRFRLSRCSIMFTVMLCLLLVVVPTTFATGAETRTIRSSTTETFVDAFPPPPCQGVMGTLTITINSVLHQTQTPNGSFHAAGTFTGVLTFVPDDQTQPSYTGHFASHFGINTNRRNFTYTGITNILAKGSDGSRVKLHETYHLTMVDGNVIVEVEKPRCG